MLHPKLQGHLKGLNEKLSKIYFTRKTAPVIIGIIATAWFLIRVIPKPSRAGYPCMRVAYPIMSGFIVWLLGISGVIVSFKLLLVSLEKRKLATFTVALLALLSTVAFNSIRSSMEANSQSSNYVYHPSNMPFGEGQGIIPGSVVWAWDSAATNENCTNNLSKDDGFFLEKNNNQEVIDNLVSQSVLRLTDQRNSAAAWDTLFRYFNHRKGKGSVGYQEGETVFVKINMGCGGWSTKEDFSRWKWAEGYSETSPQVSLSVIRQLVYDAGVPEENIIIADPIAHMYQDLYYTIYNEFPNVIFGDKNRPTHGRTLLTVSEDTAIFYSDKGQVLEDDHDFLYAELQNADYMINIAALKAHARAGITLTAKNHYGSHTRDDAEHLHPGLVAEFNDQPVNLGYGLYRTQVDIMGSQYLGRNTLLYVIDGLWGGPEATEPPVKWNMYPFNKDWPNSILMSLDQVALESVCFDFLREEATLNPDFKNRPNFDQGVDDYLHQAASSDNWPAGIVYDPDKSGTPIPSLGIHEHWNNPVAMQYSANMGKGYGIELIRILPKQQFGNDADIFDINTEIPEFDGIANETIWKKANWQYIDQAWIPYGAEISSDNFTGRYKMLWSASENRIYVLAETTDNDYVDGYVYPEDGYANYDILEIFIDEDQSGGLHVFDNSDSWGKNGENALSYHIAIDFPEDGDSTLVKHVLDITGTGWGDKQIADYADHFPDFTARRDGNKITWEFSFTVYDDSYDPTKTAAENAGSIVDLSAGKTLGMALAYCDADGEAGRDYFIGSDWGSDKGGEFNDYWKLADNYASVTLKSDFAGPEPVPSEKGDTVKSLYMDEHAALWIGTDNGLLRMKDDSWTAYNTGIGIPGIVNSIAPQQTKYGMEIWMANHHGSTVASYTIDGISGATNYNAESTLLESDTINAVIVDEEGTRFFATTSGLGIFKGSEWSFFSEVDVVKNMEFTDLASDGNVVYIATKGNGVARLTYNVDAYSGASPYVTPWSALPSDTVNCVYIDTDGNQWYGTVNGLVRHSSDKAKEDWDNYLSEGDLPNTHINDINEDPAGNFWIATNGGLIRLATDNTQKHYTTSEGLPDNTVNTIFVENENSIWLGTNRGLANFNGSEFTSYLTSDYAVDFINIMNPTDISASQSTIETLSIYPNPATEFVSFKLNTQGGNSPMSLSVYNSNGTMVKIISDLHNVGDRIYWDLSDENSQKVNSGTYVVVIRYKNSSSVGRLLVL